MKLTIPTILAAIIAVLGTNAAQAQPNPSGIKLDHYACYRLSAAKPFKQKQVKLLDQFGHSSPIVVREQFLCAPTSKNGHEVINKQDHLLCYVVTNPKNAGKKVEVTNQFGTAVLTIGGTVQLCVPSLKKVL
jgi:hypothetical protein